MREASKTNQFRPPDFSDRYLQGRVLDIGAGGDKVCEWALDFDRAQGDANRIEDYFPPASFDTVHSSHCLEHMKDPVASLSAWWSLVKPGGYLVLVVPDEQLYEQGIWPSFFNHDHKSSFRLDREPGLTPVSHDIGAMCRALPGAQIVSAAVQDSGYDRALLFPRGLQPRRIGQPWKLAWSVLKRTTGPASPLRHAFRRSLVARGFPIDQTRENVLAQIEVIVRKQ